MNEATGPSTLFGPRKLDPETYAAQQEMARRTSDSGVVFGHRKVDPPAPKANPFIPEGDEDGNRYVTLKELQSVLTEKPALLDEAMTAEFRDDRPRQGALKIFRSVEEAREGGARPEILELLKSYEERE